MNKPLLRRIVRQPSQLWPLVAKLEISTVTYIPNTFRTTSAPFSKGGFLTVLLILVMMGALSAQTTTLKKAPDAGKTNIVLVPATTDAPATNATADASSADDGDKDDGKGHSATITIGGSDHSGSKDTFFDGISEFVIPMVGILASFGTPVLIVFFVCYFKYRRRQENLATVREYLNKGLPVPPQLLDESLVQQGSLIAPDVVSRARADIRKGIKYMAVGTGISLALFVAFPHTKTFAWGLIVLVIGIGYLISGELESRGSRNDPPRPNPLTPGAPPRHD